MVVRIYILNELKFSFQLSGVQKWIFIFVLGAILGFIAGTVGIGGGIYLVPLIIMFVHILDPPSSKPKLFRKSWAQLSLLPLSFY